MVSGSIIRGDANFCWPTIQPAESSHSRKFILNIDLQGMFILTYSCHVLLKLHLLWTFNPFFLSYLIYVEKDISPIMVISHLLAHYTWFMDGTQQWCEHNFFSPGKEKLIFAWKRFLCRPLNPQFERISMHGMFYPLGNIPIPAIRCSAIDKAIHPNGIWRQWGVGSG